MAATIPDAILAPITGNSDVPPAMVAIAYLIIGIVIDRVVLKPEGN